MQFANAIARHRWGTLGVLVLVIACGFFLAARPFWAGIHGERLQHMPVIGIARWVDNPEHNKNIEAFKSALAEAGYIEGKTVAYLEPPASEADPEKHRALIRSFVSQHVDMMYSLTTPGTLIAKAEAPSTLPVVFSIVTYPMEAGLITSYQHSENNLVGTRNWVPMRKQLFFFHQLVPDAKSIGFVYRKGEINSEVQLNKMGSSATLLGLQVVPIPVQKVDEIDTALDRSLPHIDALYSPCDTLVQGQQGEDIVIAFAQAHHMPDFACMLSGVRKGSLIGTVADIEKIGELAGEKAVAVLRGKPPSSLETSTAASFFFYVNAKTAHVLHLTIPESILIEAKEIIH